MKTSLTIFLVALALTQITGCIEVRDKDKQENKSGVGVGVNNRDVDNFDLDEPAYLVNGQIMKEQEFRYALADKNSLIWSDQKEWTITAKNFHLGKNAILYTLGVTLTVKAENLLSDGGQITTFPNGMNHPGRNGRSGGEIMIIAQEASGVLAITMRGEDGAPGLPGKDPDESKRGGSHPDRMPTLNDPRGGSIVFERGKQGYQGGDGFSGGIPGRAILQIVSMEKFKPYPLCIGGKGGAPGEGGRGGDPLPAPFTHYINPDLVGPTGERGQPGKDGLVTDNNCVLLNPPAKY